MRLFFLIYILVFAAKTFGTPLHSFVVSSTESTTGKESKVEDSRIEDVPKTPQIYEMHIQSNVHNRFSLTTVTSKVKNYAQKAEEVTFSVVLPETAFISGFIMEIDGKNYTAYVKEKEEAKREYEQAVSSGLGAAHVAANPRDSNRFTVSINVEPETKASFYLSYEELLKRKDGRYEQVINIHPGQLVQDLTVEVAIKESRKITELKAPPLRSGNEIGKENSELDPRATIEHLDDKTATIKFSPNIEIQKQLGHLLGNKDDDGLAGQFVVQYEVERDPHGGEVLIQDGYFVHFFAPTELKPLPKYVVFVLDTSSSMWGEKIQQLKEAMHKILEQLHSNDAFSLVEFNTNVKAWDLVNPDSSVWYPLSEGQAYGQSDDSSFEDIAFPKAVIANSDNIKKAKSIVSELTATAATDIYSALKVGLRLIGKMTSDKIDETTRQPILVFLTDGDPTVRLTNTQEISNKISEYNTGSRKTPIYTLSFGRGADKNFLEKLSLRNQGFSKHIYDAADAALQLEDFYKQISSPLLADVTFKYEDSITSLTKTEFPIHFKGSELVVSGRYDPIKVFSPPTIKAWCTTGIITVKPEKVERPVSNIERLWAYLTIKQLLDKKEISDKDVDTIKKQALKLALEYSFVTPLSSLVVVKPNATNAVETERASEGVRGDLSGSIRPLYSFPRGPPPFHPSLPGWPGLAGMPGPSISQHMASVHKNVFIGPPGISMTTPIFHNFATISLSNKLSTIMPWLEKIINAGETVSLPSGDFKLGLNETISDEVSCPKTPLGAVGHCTLLQACPQVHSLLKTLDVFVQHSCVLKNTYAGVCCPTS